jgi:hypothetical protein
MHRLEPLSSGVLCFVGQCWYDLQYSKDERRCIKIRPERYIYSSASREGADPLRPHPCGQELAISPVAVHVDAKGSLLISAHLVGYVPLSAISWHSPIQTWLGEADRAENFTEFAWGEADFVKDCIR